MNKYKTNNIQNLVLLEIWLLKKLFIDNYDLYNNSELGKELLSKMEKNETIKSLIKNNMPEEDIIKFAQISKEDLDEIKKSMGK